ncbi:MAG: DUF4367 domain-containing protein [Ruminiclostridium sp.]|nr:DUF4367 domain-containing protein [Ruminiclostridium sp.]
MAESTRQTGQDHSKFDNMSTAELNEYLRQDSYCEDSNLDDILYVMEVLERREKEDGNYSPPDVQKAWAEFQKYYNTEDNDGKPLHDFDDEDDDEPTAEIISIKKARKGLNRTIKSIISVAAVLCVILAGSVTAKALGYDIWDAIIVWTKDTFGFETTVNEPKPSEYVKQIPEELTELNDLMLNHGLSNKLIPSYIPEGYKMGSLEYDDLGDADTIFCQLSNGANDIMLIYSIHSGDSTSFQLEKDALSPEKYESGGTTYYIMSNMDDYLVSWLSDNVECTILGIPSHDEALKMITSLYQS